MAGLDCTVHKSRSIGAEGLASERYAAIIRDDAQTILGVRWVWAGWAGRYARRGRAAARP